MTRRMPEQDKPYRVYRGGRVRGKVPALAKEARRGQAEGTPSQRPGPAPRRRRFRIGRWIALVLGLFLLWLTAWSLASYFSFRDGVSAAQKRLPPSVKAQLKSQGGLLATHSTTILLLGTDHAASLDRSADRHSDSILLVRTDPSHNRISYLSIARDLYVEIPDHGRAKLNAAYQIGGPSLTLATIRKLTGLDVNHVVIVDFAQFKNLIDQLGGITIDVKKPILSNSFDCPYSASKCASWQGWHFEKGRQHMDGQRALVYSRIRENRLNPGESDATRAERQQQVLQAIASKLASVGTFLDLPFSGADLLKPLATDLSTSDFLQLGWVKFRSGDDKALHCRLGGQLETIGGQSVVQANEDDFAVMSMFTGNSASQPPRPGSGIYGSGCVIGSQTLGTR
jgi:polyisoprenyl-teichoic acid--peptidoglycan teichoic acid transferase